MSKLRRTTRAMIGLVLLVGSVAALSGCSGPSATSTASSTTPTASKSAPATAATLELIAPSAGSEVAAGDVKLSVRATGLKFTMASNTNVPGEGHVHFTLDDKPFKMSVEPEYTYEGVAAGSHTLVAELVNNDTTPFSPPVKQEITFTAK